MKVILASASERRQELLGRIIDSFDIMVSNFDESTVVFDGSIDNYVKEISIGKALEVKERLDSDAIIISADTVVTFNDRILGKPKDEKEAFEMLKSLQGRSHKVYTGITVINTKKNIVKQESISTEVTFSKVNDEDIIKYIKTGEPMDKAGSYGIQGKGGVFVERINGCYYNVVGLPLNRLKAILEELG